MNHAARHQDDPHVRLSLAILTGGYRDLDDKANTHNQRSGRRFFVLGRFKLWADMARIDYGVVMDGYRNVLANGLPAGDRRRERYRRSM